MTWYPAPGKLNLFLHVLGLRTDGYHELQTVFRLIDRCDRVGIAPRSDGKVRFEGPLGEEISASGRRGFCNVKRSPGREPICGSKSTSPSAGDSAGARRTRRRSCWS